nr:non-specific lipid-transfer protein 2-like [Ipomoea batatas]
MFTTFPFLSPAGRLSKVLGQAAAGLESSSSPKDFLSPLLTTSSLSLSQTDETKWKFSQHLGIETLQVLMAFLAAGELTYAFKLGFLRHGVSCCTLHAAEENCASAKSSNSIARIMRLKKPFIFAVLMLLLAEAQFSSAACDVQPLTPCLSALTSNTNPSQLCCQRLNQQKPCFCQYLKNPSLKMYLNSPAAKKAAKTCNVSIPKC